MLSVRHHPELCTRDLEMWLTPHIRYDAEGLSSVFLVEDQPLPPPLARIALALYPEWMLEDFRAVALRGYKDGRATTPCHSDAGATGFCFILSLGATRTLRFHRVPSGTSPRAGCGNPDLDAVSFECVHGTVVLMDEEFQQGWHHQVAPDPGVRGERLSLVFRTRPTPLGKEKSLR